MDVVLVRWPAETDRRRRSLEAGAPCLLIVDPEVAPPLDLGDLEDWVRLPAADQDVRARVTTLLRRADNRYLSQPSLDGEVIRYQGRCAPLPPVEARLAAALVERFEAVVSRDALGRAGWPEGPPGRNALDVHIMRLRRRLEPVGLAIRTVRSRGYLLGPAA